jgi:hypothetical protein
MMCNIVLNILCNVLFQYLVAPWHHNESSHCVAKKSDFSKVYEHIKMSNSLIYKLGVYKSKCAS